MTKEMKAIIGLLLATVAWGASFPIISKGLNYISAYTFLMLRFLISSLILMIIYRKRFNKLNKKTIAAGIIIGIAMFLGSVFQTIGLIYTTPSKSGFITGLNVVMVPIIISIIKRKIPNLNIVVGAILSVFGLGLVSLNGNLSLNYGDTLTVLAALAFSFQIIAIDKFSGDIDAILLMTIEFLTIGILSIGPSIMIEKLNFTPNYTSVGMIVYTILFCTLFAYGLQNFMQPNIDPSNAAIIFLAEPVFSAIFSVFVGDIITIKTLIGCLIIFLSMIIVSYKDIVKKRSKEGICSKRRKVV